MASPEATPAKFCSAIPTLKNLSGNLSANRFIFVDSVKSAVRATILSSFPPAKRRPSPKPLLVDFNITSLLNIFVFSFKF